MPVSKYPRPGRPLAPRTLRAILGIPAVLLRDNGASPPLRLDELDESVWTRFPADICEALARQVVEQVRQSLPLTDPVLAHQRVPQLPAGVGLDDLELETRTRNLLAEEGYEEHIDSLLHLTVADLLDIPGFGARCLVDLLTSLESFDIGVVRYPWASRRFLQILEYEINNLLANSNVSLVHRSDPRFEQILTVLSLLSAADDYLFLRDLVELARQQADGVKKPVELINALQEARIRLDAAVSMPLEDELLDIIPNGAPERNRRILYRRMGWDGRGTRTLQELVDEFGLTREGIRKICKQLLEELRRRRPFAPTLNRALTLVERHAPTPADEIEELMQKDGLTRGRFDLRALLAAADVMGRESPIVIETVDGQDYALHRRQNGLPGLILEVARESVTHWGMANVGDLAAKVAAGAGLVVDARFVVKVLERVDGLHWLDARGGWFWLSTLRHNRLLNQVKKIMAVARELDVLDLRRGIARHHRMEGFAPPADVLLELCRQQPLYHVRGDTVVADQSLDWHDVLGTAERLMVEVLQAHGGVMDVDAFADACRERGLKESTFYTYLDYSPLLTKHTRGVYGLRGTRAPEPRKPTSRRDLRRVLLDYGAEPDGRVWLRYRLSRAAIIGGIVSVPKALEPVVRGNYRLYAMDGSPVGTLRVDRGLAWRLAPFFRRYGTRINDELRLELDPSASRAVATTSDNAMIKTR
ncbi:MAG: hypothetical protein Kow00122_00900 [Thermoleophilia bacterium]